MTKEQVIEKAKEQYSEIWDCDINHPKYEDTVEEIVTGVIRLIMQPTFDETIKNVLSHIETGITATGQSDSYCVGFCNALVWLKSCITHEEPQYFEDKRGNENVSS